MLARRQERLHFQRKVNAALMRKAGEGQPTWAQNLFPHQREASESHLISDAELVPALDSTEDEQCQRDRRRV